MSVSSQNPSKEMHQPKEFLESQVEYPQMGSDVPSNYPSHTMQPTSLSSKRSKNRAPPSEQIENRGFYEASAREMNAHIHESKIKLMGEKIKVGFERLGNKLGINKDKSSQKGESVRSPNQQKPGIFSKLRGRSGKNKNDKQNIFV